MYKLTILVSTFARNEFLVRLLDSIFKNAGKNHIKIVIFNNNDGDITHLIKNKKNTNIQVVNNKKNIGKNFNILNYAFNHPNEYILPVDDKWEFINSIDEIVDFICTNRSDLYTLKMQYKNHPLDFMQSRDFCCKTMRQYYMKNVLKNRLNDRAWIFNSDIFYKNKKIKKMLNQDFIKNEISISGLVVHFWYYKISCLSINNIPYVRTTYLKEGNTHNKKWWVDNEPNSRLWENCKWIKLSYNVYKILMMIYFCKTYSEITNKKQLMKKFKFYYVIMWPFYFVYLIANIFCKKLLNKIIEENKL